MHIKKEIRKGDVWRPTDVVHALGVTGGSGGVKIRPIRLPQREKVSADDDDSGEKADSLKRPSADVRDQYYKTIFAVIELP